VNSNNRSPTIARRAAGRLRAAWAVPWVLATAGLAGCSAMPPHVDSFDATLPPDEVPQASNGGAIYQVGHDVPLFENSVAHRVGDVITITLEEKTDASKSASTTTAKTTKANLTAPTVFGAPVTVNGVPILSGNLGNATSFDGSGDSKQSNALTGSVSVTVAKRLANGNLLVRGQKWITINQGREFVRIQGVVRPVDIGPDNTVSSLRVADASISYGQQGVIDSANHKGLLARFFDWKWSPF
jgi:flagellar L-ring protein precursor FlgH